LKKPCFAYQHNFWFAKLRFNFEIVCDLNNHKTQILNRYVSIVELAAR